MELIIILITILSILIVNSMMKIDKKEMEKIALDEELNKIAEKYPKNIEICKTILNKLGNKTTKIEEDINSETTLYIAIHDKISIGNTHNSYTRIQTMAHECLHSVQSRKLLIFNFIFSNLYIIYMIIIYGLLIFNKLSNEIMYSNILLILGFTNYTIRIFLENEAMIKAEYIAKEYIEEQNISSKEEIKKLCEGFKKLNKGCIKGTNCSLFTKNILKVTIFNILALIF